MTSFTAKFYLKIQVAYAGSMDKLHHFVVYNFFYFIQTTGQAKHVDHNNSIAVESQNALTQPVKYF